MMLQSLIEKRGISVKYVSQLSGIDLDLLNEEFDPDKLKSDQLKLLAEILGVSESVFYSKKLPELHSLPEDFRTAKNYAPSLSLAALKSIYKTYEVLNFFESVLPYSNTQFDDTFSQYMVNNLDTNQASEAVAKLFKIDGEELLSIGSAYEIFYHLRLQLESTGVLVFCDKIRDHSVKGYCTVLNDRRAVFINVEKQTYQARVFTLVHEVVHLLVGRPGIVDTFHSRIDLERFCNKITAQYLLPKKFCIRIFNEHCKELDGPEIVDEFAKHMPYSKYFAAVRLQETIDGLGNIVSSWLESVSIFYPTNPSSENISRFTDQVNEQDVDEIEEGAFQAHHTSASYQVARLGFSAVSLAQNLIQTNTINRFDLQYYLNLPAKHQEKVFKSYNNKIKEVSKYGTS